MPKVSVIIPVYNVEKYLGECLDSVLRQTFKDLEIICVDDGSTDSSPKILAEYAAKDARIRVITQPNAGLSAARNAGMDAANGKYIYFLDSDDYITDDAMERCVEICERDNLDQLVFGCRVKAESGATDERVLSRKEAYYSLPGAICGAVMPGSRFLCESIKADWYFPSVPLRFVRRAVPVGGGLHFPQGLLHEDEYFTPLLLALSGRTKAIDERLYVRRLRAGSIMLENSADSVVRHLAHRLLIYVRLRNDAAAVRPHLSHDGGAAVDILLKRLFRRLVRGICRRNVSVGDVWRGAQSVAQPGNLLGHGGLRLRLGGAALANRCIRLVSGSVH